jgi:uncharacterized protein YhaN
MSRAKQTEQQIAEAKRELAQINADLKDLGGRLAQDPKNEEFQAEFDRQTSEAARVRARIDHLEGLLPEMRELDRQSGTVERLEKHAAQLADESIPAVEELEKAGADLDKKINALGPAVERFEKAIEAVAHQSKHQGLNRRITGSGLLFTSFWQGVTNTLRDTGIKRLGVPVRGTDSFVSLRNQVSRHASAWRDTFTRKRQDLLEQAAELNGGDDG